MHYVLNVTPTWNGARSASLTFFHFGVKENIFPTSTDAFIEIRTHVLPELLPDLGDAPAWVGLGGIPEFQSKLYKVMNPYDT